MRQPALGLDRRARRVGVVEHHVVRVDQVDRQVPGLALRRKVAALEEFVRMSCEGYLRTYKQLQDFSRKAPVGQTRTHCPQLTQDDTFSP